MQIQYIIQACSILLLGACVSSCDPGITGRGHNSGFFNHPDEFWVIFWTERIGNTERVTSLILTRGRPNFHSESTGCKIWFDEGPPLHVDPDRSHIIFFDRDARVSLARADLKSALRTLDKRQSLEFYSPIDEAEAAVSAIEGIHTRAVGIR